MRTIQVELKQKSYPIYISNNLLAKQEIWARHIHGQQVFIVTQENIAHFYLASIHASLAAYQCDVLFLPEGEQYKNIIEWEKIISALVQKKHDRSTTLIALGGGVIGDITGFAAACYQRGVNYIQVPTSLIAQVDSAIGGKTGINHPRVKNLIGAFHQPQCVIADIATLNTLPPREFNAGIAEVIKYGLIFEAEFFNWLENNISLVLAKDPKALLHMITTCAAFKAAVVTEDEKDHGRRQLLNFGHTFGHALESVYAYQTLLHGEAVAMGMLLAAKLSTQINGLPVAAVERIHRLLTLCGLALSFPDHLDSAEITALMQHDKKVSAGKINLILLQAIGKANKALDVPAEMIKMLLDVDFAKP